MDERSRQDKSKGISDHRSEGEGNKTAERQYNKGQRQFVRGGKVDEQTQKAIERAERDELEHAELVGERHIAEEHPPAKRR